VDGNGVTESPYGVTIDWSSRVVHSRPISFVNTLEKKKKIHILKEVIFYSVFNFIFLLVVLSLNIGFLVTIFWSLFKKI